jgi:hypothetical protein
MFNLIYAILTTSRHFSNSASKSWRKPACTEGDHIQGHREENRPPEPDFHRALPDPCADCSARAVSVATSPLREPWKWIAALVCCIAFRH